MAYDTGAPVLRVQGLRKTFTREDGSTVPALQSVSLDLFRGECVVLLGPSGCGKTTLLRSVAGLETPDDGRIEIAGNLVLDASRRVNRPPERRGLSMIFQSYALWPHLTAAQNVAYPLESRSVDRPEARERVAQALRLVGLDLLAGQYPSQMSGGQQQRVALARAIVANDELILFDEPLSNVDAKVREQLRAEIRALQRELGFSALYVTHDQDEALELADRLAVMADGEILQLGPPTEIYKHPSSARVANFVGRTNELSGTVERVEGGAQATVKTDLGPVLATVGQIPVGPGSNVVLLCRPERCRLSNNPPDVPNAWEATVRSSVFLGTHCEELVEIGATRLRTWRPGADQLSEGARLWLSVHPDDLRVMPG